MGPLSPVPPLAPPQPIAGLRGGQPGRQVGCDALQWEHGGGGVSTSPPHVSCAPSRVPPLSPLTWRAAVSAGGSPGRGGAMSAQCEAPAISTPRRPPPALSTCQGSRAPAGGGQ